MGPINLDAIQSWNDLTPAIVNAALYSENAILELFTKLVQISEFGTNEGRIMRFLAIMAKRSWDGEFRVEITSKHTGICQITLLRISGDIAELIKRIEAPASFLELKRAALDLDRIYPLTPLTSSGTVDPRKISLQAVRGTSMIPLAPKEAAEPIPIPPPTPTGPTALSRIALKKQTASSLKIQEQRPPHVEEPEYASTEVPTNRYSSVGFDPQLIQPNSSPKTDADESSDIDEGWEN